MLRSVRGRARVRLHGRVTGELTFQSGGSSFAYTDDLLDPEHNVLGQVFEENPRARFRQVSGLRRYYAARFGQRVIDDARLLLSVGSDLPGAVTVEPMDVPDEGVLVDAAEARVGEGRLHLSALAGAQPKMSVARDGERLTLPARGETGGWIAKFPNPTWAGLIENEFLMMRWARAAGIDTPPVSLLPAKNVPDIFDSHLEPGVAVFAVERESAESYDTIGRYLRTLLPEPDIREYLSRLTTMAIMGNGDAHLKNWSLVYPDGRTARLSPAYDLVCTTYYRNLGDKLVFPLGGQVRSDQVGMEEFIRLAYGMDFDPEQAVAVVRATADALRSSWPEVRDPSLAPDLVAHIDRRLAKHPLR